MTTRQPLRKIEVNSADQVAEIVDRIVRAYDPIKIIMFGSQARGDARRDSDVDLLVVLDDPVDDKRKATVGLLRLVRDLVVALDVVVTTPAEIAQRGDTIGSILRPALRDGKPIYVR